MANLIFFFYKVHFKYMYLRYTARSCMHVRVSGLGQLQHALSHRQSERCNNFAAADNGVNGSGNAAPIFQFYRNRYRSPRRSFYRDFAAFPRSIIRNCFSISKHRNVRESTKRREIRSAACCSCEDRRSRLLCAQVMK